MSKTLSITSLIGLTADPRPPGQTSFSRLSEEAQDLIVRAAIGEFDNQDPPEISESVQEEIRQWAVEHDSGVQDDKPDVPESRYLIERTAKTNNRWMESCEGFMCDEQMWWSVAIDYVTGPVMTGERNWLEPSGPKRSEQYRDLPVELDDYEVVYEAEDGSVWSVDDDKAKWVATLYLQQIQKAEADRL